MNEQEQLYQISFVIFKRPELSLFVTKLSSLYLRIILKGSLKRTLPLTQYRIYFCKKAENMKTTQRNTYL